MMGTLDSGLELPLLAFKKEASIILGCEVLLSLALRSWRLQFSFLASINHWNNKTNKRTVMVLIKNLESHTLCALRILIYFLDMCLSCKLISTIYHRLISIIRV